MRNILNFPETLERYEKVVKNGGFPKWYYILRILPNLEEIRTKNIEEMNERIFKFFQPVNLFYTPRPGDEVLFFLKPDLIPAEIVSIHDEFNLKVRYPEFFYEFIKPKLERSPDGKLYKLKSLDPKYILGFFYSKSEFIPLKAHIFDIDFVFR